MGGAYQGVLRKSKDSLENQSARLAYRVIWEALPTKPQRNLLASLLDATEQDPPSSGVMAMPKRDTVSAWCSKATEIAKQCGLPVFAMERGVHNPVSGQIEFDPLLEEILADFTIASWMDIDITGPGKSDREDSLPKSKCDEPLFHPAVSKGLVNVLNGLGRKLSIEERLFLVQLNSDHSRHWTFRSKIKEVTDSIPLLNTIKSTHKKTPDNALVAFTDHAAVLDSGRKMHTVLKSETHNHPTAISPFFGAATGVGGEIRDEMATGGGAQSVAGIAGYMVSGLGEIEESQLTFDKKQGSLCNPLRIALDAPLGAAAYSNEFGRPIIAGFFRSFEKRTGKKHFGFHKPLMLSGGMGEIAESTIYCRKAKAGDLLVHLGGPGMKVGMNGAVASSGPLVDAHDLSASVQRDNAEMQRRVQQVIDVCARKKQNLLVKLHDIGAGGIANAVAELVHPLGCKINIELIPLAQGQLSDSEILFNEAQERFIALVEEKNLRQLEKICQIENCPVATIGKVLGNSFIAKRGKKKTINIPCEKLFPDEDKAWLEAQLPKASRIKPVDPSGINIVDACHLVLANSAVADKSFLVTIADRNVGGLTTRDQLVGPLQIPVADCGVVGTAPGLASHGRAIAVGERAPLAVFDPAAAARIAIAESLTNLASAPVGSLDKVKLSINWMADGSTPEGVGELVCAVRGACDGFLAKIGVAVVTGKDSVSMRTETTSNNGKRQIVVSPTSCVSVACGHMDDTRMVKTPLLSGKEDTVLMLLRAGNTPALGGSALAQELSLNGNDVPDIDPNSFVSFWKVVMSLHEQGLMLAYHDISDGGIVAAICEMAFASRCGATLVMDSICQPKHGYETDGSEIGPDLLAQGGLSKVASELFHEGIGAIIEVKRKDAAKINDIAIAAEMDTLPQTIGWPTKKRFLKVAINAVNIVDEPMDNLQASWKKLSLEIRKLRDNKDTFQNNDTQGLGKNHGLYATKKVPRKKISSRKKPNAVVLRDQGTNGHREMAAALDKACFKVKVISITELLLEDHLVKSDLLALPGGFSHGDVLSAGAGTAHVVMNNKKLAARFKKFFARPTLTLGVCNGCQILSKIHHLMPDKPSMPQFERNLSRRFEAHLAQVEILPNPSPFLSRLASLRLPAPISCGEGRAVLQKESNRLDTVPAMRFVDGQGLPSLDYPVNITGSDMSYCGFTTHDGKVTLLMPHPERAYLSTQMSWNPPDWKNETPWHESFASAREHLISTS